MGSGPGTLVVAVEDMWLVVSSGRLHFTAFSQCSEDEWTAKPYTQNGIGKNLREQIELTAQF